MNRIGIVGHSRGGEGVVAAAEINAAEPATYGHSIIAVAAIAPTDQQSGTKWDIKTAPYFLLASAAVEEVRNWQKGAGTNLKNTKMNLACSHFSHRLALTPD